MYFFLNRLSALALREIGDAPCGYGYFLWHKQKKVTRLKAKRNETKKRGIRRNALSLIVALLVLH